jgi:hypothetical protein
MEIDAKGWGLKPLALGLQALWERFPLYPGYNADSVLATLAGTWIDHRGDVVVFTLGGRIDQTIDAMDALWSYDSLSASLYGRVVLPWRFALGLTAVAQPQWYRAWPATLGLAADARRDEQWFVNPELSRSLPRGLSLFTGAQWTANDSNSPLYTTSGLLAYGGVSWSR